MPRKTLKMFICIRYYSSITRTLNFLIENCYKFFYFSGYPNKNVTSENTELKQGTLKLNTTCCNVDVVLYVATFCIITS